MEFKDLLTTVTKIAKTHSPEILMALGISGMMSTVYLTGKASFEAARLIDLEEEEEGPNQDTRKRIMERTKLVWKLYIPAAASGAVSVACAIGSFKASGRKTTAAITAYSLTERAFAEYKEKVVEELGKGKSQKIVDQIAQDRVLANPEPSKEVVILPSGHVLCHESYTGRYFRSDMESLRKAENDINAKINHERYVTLDEFYELVGLMSTSNSGDLGWDSDRLLALEFSTVISESGEPCISFNYNYVKPLT
jgi:Family of unknown function (DUF6353)